MQTTFKIFVSFLLCLGLLLVGGCGEQGASSGTSSSGSSDSSLVGRWVLGEGQQQYETRHSPAPWNPLEQVPIQVPVFPKEKEFFRDGNAIIRLQSVEGRPVGADATATWKAESGRLHFMHATGQSLTFRYRISGSTLTFTDEDDESLSVTYNRR